MPQYMQLETAKYLDQQVHTAPPGPSRLATFVGALLKCILIAAFLVAGGFTYVNRELVRESLRSPRPWQHFVEHYGAAQVAGEAEPEAEIQATATE